MENLSIKNGVLQSDSITFELTSDGILTSSVLPTLTEDGRLVYTSSSSEPSQPDYTTRNKRLRMYIAKPNRKTQRNLAGVESAKLRAFLNDIWEIQFDVNKYTTNRKGQVKENPIYGLLEHSNEIQIETLGWFRINTKPKESYSNDGRWHKTFTAYGYETTLQDIDLVGININCGTDDSLEMFEENLDEFGVPKHNIQLYIKEESNDPTSEKYWMLGLLNILEHEYLSQKGWTIGTVETGLSSLRGRQFEISSMNAYRFITCELPAAYKCMPIFDRVNKVINFVKLESLGKDLNIEFNLRNFINDVDIEDSNNDYYNCFHVAGSDKETALIEYINYGTNLLRNIKYPIETGQVSDSIATKYSAYEEFIESNRETYAGYTRQYLKLSEERSNLYDLMPVDEVDVFYTNTSDEELQTELLHFQTIVSLLEELHTVDGVLQIEGTNDYPLYISSKNVMIPKIQEEIDARENGKHADTFDYSTNWVLYGINELENRKTAYERQLDVLAEKGYDNEWSEDLGTSQTAHEKQHSLYLEYAAYVDAINTRLNKLNTRVAEIDALIETNTTSQNILAAKAKITHENWGFTDEELDTLNILFRETDFQDTTIEILDTDTIDDIISLAWDLLESAKEELEIESRPQNTYSISLDNFFRHAKFTKKANSLSIGDFCWLGLDNGFHTKQRIIEMELELVNFNDNDVNLTFSDMVTVCGKADDYRFILESQNSSGKNILSRETREYINKNMGTFASQIFDKYFNSGGNSYFTYGISPGDVQKLQDALDGLIGGELSLEDLKVKLAQVDTLEANSAFIQYLNTHYLVGEQADFTELKAKLAAIDNLLAGNVSAELAHVIKLTADNVSIDEAVIKQLIASQILVSDLKAGDITLSNTMRILSENGLMVMNGETLQILGKDSTGTEYVAIQLGYDTQNNPSLIIRNGNGAIMLDAEGLHPEIVPDKFIVSDMIGDKQIGNGKIDWTSISEDVDENGKPIWNSHSVTINGEGLDVVYNTITQDIKNNTQSIEQAKVTIDQISKEIGLEVSGDTVTSSISTMKSDIEDATVGINKWLVEVYPKSTLPEENREVLDFSAFYGQDINPSFQYILPDAEISTSLGYGTDYIGYALTFVNFAADAEVSASFYKATSGTLYLNGSRCSDESGSTADETVILNFKNGWNVLEVVWSVNESATSDGFGFDVLISELENCSLMNCYYRTITGRDCFMKTKSASISINLNSITSKVEEVSSEISNKADGTTVNELSEKVSEVEQSVDAYKITVSETYATKDGLGEVNEAILTLEKNMISTVINSEEFSSNITQAKNYWKTEFQNDGAVCGSTTITKDGITVTGSDDTVGITVIGSTSGMYETRITPMEFSGSYNGQKVFWLNEDETVTRRLYVENGISLGYIKIVPVKQDDIGGIDFLGASAQLL